MIIIMMTEITMTVMMMMMKMAFMFPFIYEISSSYALLFDDETQTSSREAHVSVTNSLIKINFRIRTRNQSV